MPAHPALHGEQTGKPMINSGFCKENKVMKSKNRVANAERNHQNVSGSSNIAEQRNKNGPTSGEIRRRACEIYAERGGIDGFDLEDWLQAERELRAIQGQRKHTWKASEVPRRTERRHRRGEPHRVMPGWFRVSPLCALPPSTALRLRLLARWSFGISKEPRPIPGPSNGSKDSEVLYVF